MPVTPCLAKSHPIAVAMSLCLKQFISQKIKALTALMFTVFIYPLTQEFYPHRWRNNFIKMLSWICKNFFSISHPPIYVQAFHIASIYINSLENDSATQSIKNIIANSCTQLYVCFYHMILLMSFLYFQWIQGLTPAELEKTFRNITVEFYYQPGVKLASPG
jgi:hypothetical protein